MGAHINPMAISRGCGFMACGGALFVVRRGREREKTSLTPTFKHLPQSMLSTTLFHYII